MKSSENGSILTGFLYFWLFIVITGTSIYVITSFVRKSSTKSSTSQSTVNKKSPHDINRDGRVDELDRNMVRTAIGCKKTDDCWNKSVGKTLDGDNPLYTFDLDLNADGEISNTDIP